MSMRDYAVHDYGLVLDDQTVNVIASKVFEDYSDADFDTDWAFELYCMGICEYISSFTGEAFIIDEDDQFDVESIANYADAVVCYVPLANFPTLFKKAYNSIEEIVVELKSKIGGYLPEDFDYRSRVVHIVGNYYG